MTKPRNRGSVGIDIADASRFKKILSASATHQLAKLFSYKEILYCRSFKDAAIHFAGHFAAKEAASKALGTRRHPFTELEIKHSKDGVPEVWLRKSKGGKKLPLRLSISHTKTIAVAVAIS